MVKMTNENKKDFCEASALLYGKGWIFGAAGSLSVKNENGIYMTPQKVLPDKLKEEELFVYENDTLEKKETPENLEVCESSATFLSIYEMHDPGAIIHCANNSVLISAFQCREDEFRIKNHSMIKALNGEKELIIPVLNDTEKLSEIISDMLDGNSEMFTVLVKGKGLFVWGKDLDHCIFRCEALQKIFEFSIEMGKLGLKEFTYVPKKVVKPAAVPKPAAKPVGNHAKKGPATPQQANKNNMPRNSPVTPQNDNNVRNGRIQKKNGNRRGGKNWQQKKKQQNMNVIMNY